MCKGTLSKNCNMRNGEYNTIDNFIKNFVKVGFRL